jgi:hypothetical protein
MTETAGLLAAMLAVQGEAPTLPKDRTVEVPTKTGGKYTYSYTPLDTIVEKVGPLLHKNGLVWSTKPSWREDVGPTLKYKLAHAPSGECEEGEMPLMLADQDAQSMGSAITYMRRYAFTAVLNLVADADDDGALATAGGRGGGALASDKQKKFLRTLITQNNLTAEIMDTLFKGAGFQREDGEKVNDAINRLSKQQCSTLIETIKDGAVKTGESDVPSDASDFERPPIVDDGTLPFDPGVPQ